MNDLKPGDIWHSLAAVDIIYQPDAEEVYDDPEVTKIYKKEKEDD